MNTGSKFLNSTNFFDVAWCELEPKPTEFLFIPYSYDLKSEYEKGFKVSDLFILYNSGIQTKCDEISVCFSKQAAEEVESLFKTQPVSELKSRYPAKNDGRDWTFSYAKNDVMTAEGKIVPYYYRPFDVRYIRYSGVTKGLIAYPRRDTMSHVVGRNNLSLCMMKQFFQDVVYNHIFVTNLAIDERFLYSNRGGTYIFPLYQYSGEASMSSQSYNFNSAVIKEIESRLGLNLSDCEGEVSFTGEQLLQYIYSVLYCKSYRERFNDQLKYDFPSIPYPTSPSRFRELCLLGKRLMELHLPDPFYPVNESEILLPELSNYKFERDKVILNGTLVIDAFEGAKDYQLGGYKPADKWLKDRKGRAFTKHDKKTYERLLATLTETTDIMNEIETAFSFDND